MEATTELNQLIAEQWEAWMKHDPAFASYTGDHRYDDRLPGVSETWHQDWAGALRTFRQRAAAIERHALAPEDRLNLDIFIQFMDNEIREEELRGYHLPVSRSNGFHIDFPDLYLMMPFDTLRDYENYIARLEDVSRYVHEAIELMRLGLRTGYTPPRPTLEGVEHSLRAHIVVDPAQSVFYQPFQHLPASLSESQGQRLVREGQQVILRSVVPGYQALLHFLQDEYYPAARESIAAVELPQGREFYQHRIRYFTTLSLSPEAVHQTGLDEVHRIRLEMETVMRKTGFTGSFRQFIEFLRSDPRFYAQTPTALLKEVSYVLKRMDGELPRLFKTLPRLPYGIRPIPDFSAPGNTTAYYFPGAGDGSRAGMYYVNTYDLKSRPLYEIEALSLHEAVPGHHLQIALQQELSNLPNFRRFAGFTSFFEGWALYAERLGLEVGFYTDPYSDFGRLSYEMWRACRLVVDTGMHALGWTRQQAIDFMAENTSSTLLNIRNEIDRYIAWPGQSLAYKIGELKIRQLRAWAEKQLGERFNLREFHDVLLLGGALPLEVLESRVKEWVGG